MYSPGIYLGGLRELMKTPSHDTQSLGQDLTWDLPDVKQKCNLLDHNLQSVEINVRNVRHK
jgi:hypothetical protein